ncbi:HAD-IA family hydrolase [Brevundimonas sp.]|uniref:HAD-IA family hydrolase n=1 Tax=Brevundimonas sp. TaxID=1871086 RepID=UPI0025F5DDC1|nr:HAD-IA family hydrolase [Brevundimonas sp.]
MSLSGVTLAFDLDGTLVDTAPDLIGTLNVMLGERDLPHVPLASARHLVGRGARVMLEHGFQEAGAEFSHQEAPALLDQFIDLYLARIAQESRPFEGVVETLDHFAGEGANLVVVTNKLTRLSAALLDALDLTHRFAFVAGPDVVSARKPSGAHLREAVLTAGGDPARCLMVGDSAPDVACARALGAPVVLVGFGYTETAAEELGADAVISAFDELPAVVADLVVMRGT